MTFNQYLKGCTLNLKGLNNISIKNLISFLEKNSNITHLNLDGCKIREKGAKILAESQALKQLKYLNLHYNLIGNNGAVAIAQSKNLVNIEQLFLGANVIDCEGVKALAESPNLKNVKELDLSQNIIGCEGIEILAKSQYKKSRTEEKGPKFTIDEYQSLYYNSLIEAYSKDKTTEKLSTESVKDMVFRIAPHDNGGEAIMHVLKHPDTYPFLVNSRDEQGHMLSHFFTHDPEMQKFLFEYGIIPSKEDDTLQNIAKVIKVA